MSAPTPAVNPHLIEDALRRQLALDRVEVIDDSHLHAGHAGAREGSHYTVRLSGPAFAGVGRVARHRLVYDALKTLIPQGIHALAIEARAPGENASSPQPPAHP